MKIRIMNEGDVLENINKLSNPFFDKYHAFYSSWFDGIVINPRMMLLPIDDHMVHRGDGVFEAIKVAKRSAYLLDEHLHRLVRSAEMIALNVTLSINIMKHIILETLKAANQDEAIVRVYLSRGPGSFSANPYDALGTQFYVVVTAPHALSEREIQEGVSVGQSVIPIKHAWMAKVKSCNYLPNVMMKKESIDRGLDFVIGVDNHGYITEGPTENIMLINKYNTIIYPEYNNILKGITMARVCELARSNNLKTHMHSISIDDLRSAKEVMMTGTTINILPVVRFENYSIGTGSPGPVTKKLLGLLIDDINYGSERSSF